MEKKFKHFYEWLTHTINGIFKFPAWSGLTIGLFLCFVVSVVYSIFHPGKKLEWIDAA